MSEKEQSAGKSFSDPEATSADQLQADPIKLKFADTPSAFVGRRNEVSKSRDQSISSRSLADKKADKTTQARAGNKSNGARTGALVVGFFMFFRIFGGFVPVVHATLLESVGRSKGTTTHMLLTKELIDSYTNAGMYKQAQDTAQRLLGDLSSHVDKDDCRIAFAELMLAKTSITTDPKNAAQLCLLAEQLLKKSEINKSAEIGKLASEIGQAFVEANEPSLANKMFLVAQNNWRGSDNELCYAMVTAAENSDTLKDYASGLEFAQKSVEAAKRVGWINTSGQVERLTRVAYFLNMLHRYDEAEYIAGQAVSTAGNINDNSSYWKEKAEKQVQSARDAKQKKQVKAKTK